MLRVTLIAAIQRGLGLVVWTLGANATSFVAVVTLRSLDPLFE